MSSRERKNIEVEDQGKTVLEWTLTTHLHRLAYADDIGLLSHDRHKQREKQSDVN